MKLSAEFEKITAIIKNNTNDNKAHTPREREREKRIIFNFIEAYRC